MAGTSYGWGSIDPNLLNEVSFQAPYQPGQFALGNNFDGTSNGVIPVNTAQSILADSSGSFFDRPWVKSMLGGTDANGNVSNGWGGLALSGAGALGSFWNGRQQMALAKSQLAESKRQYDQNYEAQRKTLNTQMEDRQAARVASNPTAYQSVSEYMNKNRI